MRPSVLADPRVHPHLPAQLGRVLEVTRRLEKSERPARRHRRRAEQRHDLAHHTAYVAPRRGNTRRAARPSRCRRCARLRPTRRRSGSRRRGCRRTTRTRGSRSAAARRDRSRDRGRAAWSRAAASCRADRAALPPARDRRSAARRRTRSSRASRASERPVARARATRRCHRAAAAARRARDLEAEIGGRQAHRLAVHDLVRRPRPVARADVGGGRRRRRPKLDADDPRAAHGHGDRPRFAIESTGGGVGREARHLSVRAYDDTVVR